MRRIGIAVSVLVIVLAATAAFAEGLQEPKLGVGVDLSGYYRVRFDNFLDVGWVNNSDEEWAEYFDQRFRLNPTFTINDRIEIHAQIDMLYNVLWGQSRLAADPFLSIERSAQTGEDLPEIVDVELGTIDFASGDVLAETTSNTNAEGDEVPSIDLTRVWGAVLLPFGRFEFGRMPDHWGMGILNNAGDGVDDDFGDTFDRVQFSTRIGPVVPALSYSRLSEGSVTNGLSDIHQTNLNLRYLSEKISAGAYFAWRAQGSTDTTLFFYDLWVRGQVIGIVIEGEAAAVQGSSVQITRDEVRDLRDAGFPTGEGGGKIDIGAYMAAMRIYYDDPAWGVGAGAGVSSPADSSDGGEFSTDAAANVETALAEYEGDPDDADARADFLTELIQNKEAFAKSMRSYPFDPDFTVDMLLWEELLGGSVYNGVYVRAWGRANPFRWMNIRAAVIQSWINEPGRARDGSSAAQNAGIEADMTVGFSMARYFTLDLQFGYLWLGDYFIDKYRGAKNPFTMQMNFAIQF